MSIQIHNINSLKDLELIINLAKPYISPLGYNCYKYSLRGINNHNSEQDDIKEIKYLSIDSLAECIIKIAITKKFIYTDEERVLGRKTANKINHLYNEFSVMQNNCKLVQRILSIIRDLWSQTFNKTRYVWKNCERIKDILDNPVFTGFQHIFDCYTESQFQFKYFHSENPRFYIINYADRVDVPSTKYDYIYNIKECLWKPRQDFLRQLEMS